MTPGEMVTSFAVRRNWKPVPDKPGTVHDPEYAPIKELIAALNDHLKLKGCEPQEYGFYPAAEVKYEDPNKTVPKEYRWLIAFALEGGSEGFYIHVGCLVPTRCGYGPTEYVEFGLAKTWDSDQAYTIAREAQRFLTASEWN